jgi:hypothetical protein
MSEPSLPELRMKALLFACNRMPEDTPIEDLMEMGDRAFTYLRFSDFDAPRGAVSRSTAAKMVNAATNSTVFAQHATRPFIRPLEQGIIASLTDTDDSRHVIQYEDEKRVFDLIAAWAIWFCTTTTQCRTAFIAPDHLTLALMFERLALTLDRLPIWLRISSECDRGRFGINFENGASIVGFRAPSPPRGMAITNAFFVDGPGASPEGFEFFWVQPHVAKTVVLTAPDQPQPLTRCLEAEDQRRFIRHSLAR